MATLFSIVGENKEVTEAVRDVLFPDDKYKASGTKGYHWYNPKAQARDVMENGGSVRMAKLKTSVSEGSSMDTESLPGYDELYPDGGDTEGPRPNRSSTDGQVDMSRPGIHDDGPRAARSYSNGSSSGPRMERLKAVDDGYPLTNTSLPSSSGSCSDTERWVSQTQSGCDVYEVPWDRDKGSLWTLTLAAACRYIVVTNVDAINKSTDALNNCLDMVRAIHDTMTYKGHPSCTVYILGRTQEAVAKCAKAMHQKALKKLNEELAHKPNHNFVDCGVLMNNMSTEDKETILQGFTNKIILENNAIDQNNVSSVSIELFRACAKISQTPNKDIQKTDISAMIQSHSTIDSREIDATIERLEQMNIIAKATPISLKGKTPVGSTNFNHKNQSYTCVLNLQYSSTAIDRFQQMDPEFKKTPVLRYTFPDLPLYIFTRIFIHLMGCFNWVLQTLNNERQVFQNAACFKTGDDKVNSPRILMFVDRFHLYVTIVQYDHTGTVDPGVCTRLRTELEYSIRSVVYREREQFGDNGHTIPCEVQCTKASKGILHEEGWLGINALHEMRENGNKGTCEECPLPHRIVPSDLLRWWYQETDEAMSIANDSPSLSFSHDAESLASQGAVLNDSILSKLAYDFGRGWQQLFIENGLDNATVDRAREDYHVQGMVAQVHQCLREWRAMLEKEGKQLTPTILIGALKRSNFIIDIEKIKRTLKEAGVS